MKILAIVVLLYLGLVVGFESLIGFIQPAGGSTLVLTTFDADGMAHDRVLARLGQRRQSLRVGEPLAARLVPSRARQSRRAATLDGARATTASFPSRVRRPSASRASTRTASRSAS
jgi:hypothetical protein